jgi:hypothetical protein
VLSFWKFITDFGDTEVALPLAGLMAGFLLTALMFAFKRPGALFRSAAADGAARRMRRAGDRT